MTQSSEKFPVLAGEYYDTMTARFQIRRSEKLLSHFDAV
jgi:hypothetical protein